MAASYIRLEADRNGVDTKYQEAIALADHWGFKGKAEELRRERQELLLKLS